MASCCGRKAWFVVTKWTARANFDAVGGYLHVSVASCRLVSAGKDIRANVRGGFGKNDACAGGLDGDVPLVAGDVPIEFVVIFEKAQGIGDGVLNGDAMRGIVSVGHVNLELAVMADAAGFEFQAIAVGVRDGLDVEKQGVIQPLRRDVLDRNRTIEPMPRAADEMDLNILVDVDRAIGRNHDFGIELFDAQFFCGERGGDGRKKEKQEPGWDYRAER